MVKKWLIYSLVGGIPTPPKNLKVSLSVVSKSPLTSDSKW